jgi:hypothetical protein
VCACVLAQRVDDDVAVVAIVAGAWRVLLGPRMGRSVSTRVCASPGSLGPEWSGRNSDGAGQKIM